MLGDYMKITIQEAPVIHITKTETGWTNTEEPATQTVTHPLTYERKPKEDEPTTNK